MHVAVVFDAVLARRAVQEYIITSIKEVLRIHFNRAVELKVSPGPGVRLSPRARDDSPDMFSALSPLLLILLIFSQCHFIQGSLSCCQSGSSVVHWGDVWQSWDRGSLRGGSLGVMTLTIFASLDLH